MRSPFLFTLAMCVCIVSSFAFGQTTIIPYGSSWKYLDNGTDQGTAWYNTGFNDSTASGPGKLGYGEGNEATVLNYGPDPNHKYNSA